MNPVIRAICDRRSIRKYKPEQLSDEMLSLMMTAARLSPSAVNAQPWHFSFVQKKELLTRMSEAARAQALAEGPDNLREMFSKPSYDVFHGAPTVVFISTKDGGSAIDCGIAVENIAIMAQGVGLGSVILGLPRLCFQSPEGPTFEKELQFPCGYRFVIAIAIGEPDMAKEQHIVKEGLVSRIF